jgi:predicted acetyltransferase
VFLGAGVAGVQFVATLPEARGQGLGAAMTLAPLRAARDLGYQAGILQSSEVGYKVYLRLGFVKVCEVDNFYWPAPEASTLSI